MTIEAKIAEVLRIALSLGVLYIFFLWYLRHRVDVFRQKLFEIRDSLFDDALNEMISFEHPAYRMTRGRINSLIRYAHRVNTLSLVILWFGFRRSDSLEEIKDMDKALQRASSDLPKDAQERIMQVIGQSRDALFEHLLIIRLLVKMVRFFQGNKTPINGASPARIVEWEARVSDSRGTLEPSLP